MWDKAQETMFSGTSLGARCYESHKPLKIAMGTLAGGSASHPIVKDADVYVALQSGSTSGRASDPWEEGKVVEVHYSIQDMKQPSNVARFKKLITWLCIQLHEGKSVHVGCVGGHGRTGLVFAAIVAECLERKDAIQYVRKHYCKKAVESKEQIQFLMKHYGVDTADPSKGDWVSGTTNGRTYDDTKSKPRQLPGFGASRMESYTPRLKSRKLVPEGVTSKTKAYTPMESSRSLWKGRKA